MILYDRVIEVSIALFLFFLLLVVFSNYFVNSTIETVKERISNLSIDCLEIPTNAYAQITIQGKTFYCGINEKTKQT